MREVLVLMDIGGLKEVKNPGKEHQPHVEGNLVRERISRENNFGQAGETYRRFNDWEKNELISNLSGALASCRKEIQDRMVDMLTQCDPEYGKRIAEVIKMAGKPADSKMEEAVEQAKEMGQPSDPY